MTNFCLAILLDLSHAIRNAVLWFHGRLSKLIAFQKNSAVKECERISMIFLFIYFFLDNIAGLNLSFSISFSLDSCSS